MRKRSTLLPCRGGVVLVGETTPGLMLGVVLSSSELCEVVRRRDTILNKLRLLDGGFSVLLCGTRMCACRRLINLIIQ